MILQQWLKKEKEIDPLHSQLPSRVIHVALSLIIFKLHAPTSPYTKGSINTTRKRNAHEDIPTCPTSQFKQISQKQFSKEEQEMHEYHTNHISLIHTSINKHTKKNKNHNISSIQFNPNHSQKSLHADHR